MCRGREVALIRKEPGTCELELLVPAGVRLRTAFLTSAWLLMASLFIRISVSLHFFQIVFFSVFFNVLA